MHWRTTSAGEKPSETERRPGSNAALDALLLFVASTDYAEWTSVVGGCDAVNAAGTADTGHTQQRAFC